MDLLLDSHVALWWAEDPGLLDPAAGSAIANPSNSVSASAASAWELAIKIAAGKLVVDVRSLFLGLRAQGVRLLGIGVEDGIDAGSLAWDHRDPFDRMLVVQAQRSGLVLVTRDRSLLAYRGIETLAA